MMIWRRSLAVRITCVLAAVLAVSWCFAAGLSAWRTWRQIEHESLSDLTNRLQLVSRINNDELQEAADGTRKLLRLWLSNDFTKDNSPIMPRSTLSWVADPGVRESPILPRAAAAAEAYGAAGQSVIADTFFYFPGKGAAFYTSPYPAPGYTVNRARYLLELSKRLPEERNNLIWDGPHYDKSSNILLMTVAAVKRDSKGNIEVIAGYELQLNQRLSRMEQLLNSYGSFIINSQGQVLVKLDGNAPPPPRLKGFNSNVSAPQILKLEDGHAVIVRLNAPSWYLVSLYPTARLRANALQLVLDEAPFAIIGFILLTLGLLIVLHRHLARPLASFAQSIEDTHRSDDFDRRLPIDRDDELGRFAKAYNDLLDTLQNERKGLEKQVEMRTNELRQAWQISDRANLLKGQFLANMSHEIRTPLNAVIGMSHLLADTSLDARQQHFVASIQDNGNALLALINDILDFSKIESGVLDVETTTFNLLALAGDALGVLALKAEEKHLRLTLHVASNVPSKVTGDPWRLRQILVNLLGNAVKFTHSGSVQLIVWKGPESTIGFHVIDTGIGIAPDKLDAIFDAFRQANASTTRQYGGTGLGLSISRHLAQLMGGDLNVRSTPGKGASFTLTLPLPPSSDDEQLVMLPREEFDCLKEHSHRLNVLIVDDAATNREIVSLYLERFGHRYQSANNGEEALRLLNKVIFDVVLLDGQMPVMDGLETLTRIRSGNSDILDEDVWVIALTANAMACDREAFLQRGANAFLAKPVLPGQLFRALENAISWQLERGMQPELMNSTEVLNSSSYTETNFFLGQPSYLRELFRTDTLQILAQMQEAFREKDCHGLARLAHKVIGSAGQYGEPALEEVACALERHAKANAIEDIAADIYALEACCKSLFSSS